MNKNIVSLCLLLLPYLAFSQSEIEAIKRIERQTTIAVSEVSMSPQMLSGKLDVSTNSRRTKWGNGAGARFDVYDAVGSIKNSLRTVLESDIVKTKKFQVLARQDMNSIRAEETIDSKYSEFQSADYLITPTIIDFHDRFVDVPVEGSQFMARKKSFILSLEIKVHNVKEKRIMETYNAKITESDLDPNFRNMDPNQTMSDLYLNDICQKISFKVVRGLMDIVFPARVVSVEEDLIYIDRGRESGIKEGDMFEIRSKGSAIKDPDTGKILGYKGKTIGIIKVVDIVGANLSECEVVSLKSSKRKIEEGQFVRKLKENFNEQDSSAKQASAMKPPVENDYDSKSKDELLKFNAVKSLRIRAADSPRELVRAKQTRVKGESMVKEGTNLANRSDSVAGAGTTMARYVNNSSVRSRGRKMIEEGEVLIKKSDEMEREIQKLYDSLYDSCDTVMITSTDGKDIVCIPLIYENGIFTVLVRNKVFKIKEDAIDDASRKRIQIYKSL